MHISIPSRGRLLGCLLSSLVFIQAAEASIRVESREGVIVSGSQESTEAGIQVLKDGGTAADAAVAVSFTLGVSEPFNSGLGGKLIALYYEAKTQKVYCIEALNQAPNDLDMPAVLKLSQKDREKGYRSACVPGVVAGIAMMHEAWGKLPWKTCVEPAVEAARAGYAVPAKQLTAYREKFDLLMEDPEARAIYLPGDRIPSAGDIIKNPDLAKTLERIANDGPADRQLEGHGRRSGRQARRL